jgi:hypothetical protein
MGVLTKQDPPPSEGMLRTVEDLLMLVSKSYPLEADVWDVFAVFMEATDRPLLSLEYRFKQVKPSFPTVFCFDLYFSWVYITWGSHS